jgi:hypothetical protein
MLLHPEPRGGGDISPDSFPEIGRWCANRIALTAENSGTDAVPTTDEARASFRDISSDIVRATIIMAREDDCRFYGYAFDDGSVRCWLVDGERLTIGD